MFVPFENIFVRRIHQMAVTYKKLWHLLIDRNLMKKDLEEMAGITHYQMCKLARDKDVTTDVLGAVCKALDVRVEDIMAVSYTHLTLPTKA